MWNTLIWMCFPPTRVFHVSTECVSGSAQTGVALWFARLKFCRRRRSVIKHETRQEAAAFCLLNFPCSPILMCNQRKRVDWYSLQTVVWFSLNGCLTADNGAQNLCWCDPGKQQYVFIFRHHRHHFVFCFFCIFFVTKQICIFPFFMILSAQAWVHMCLLLSATQFQLTQCQLVFRQSSRLWSPPGGVVF